MGFDGFDGLRECEKNPGWEGWEGTNVVCRGSITSPFLEYEMEMEKGG